MKKIGLLCLCLASLSLIGCFHVPDEDWLPSKNKTETGDIQKDEEMEQALNSFMDGINIISSDWNELKNEENDEITTEEAVNLKVEDETISGEKISDNEIVNEEVEDEVIPEE